MSLVDIILLAIALGIDCLLVSFSQGLIFKCCWIRNSLKLAIIMGLFQGIMPVFGYVSTNSLYKYLLPYSKWVVFGIFFILGAKFIYESFQSKKSEICCMGWSCLIGLGVATSIDALVSGVSLKLTATDLLLSCVVIGVASFIMSLIGFWSGNNIKNIHPKFLEISGGVILILLAIKAVL